MSSLNQGKEVQCSKDRKSTRLNSSHLVISYAVFCLKKKKKKKRTTSPSCRSILRRPRRSKRSRRRASSCMCSYELRRQHGIDAVTSGPCGSLAPHSL